MALNQFKSWKLLYEDHDLCFSKAVNINDASNVFFITFFDPDKMSVATKHLLADHLHNYINLIEEDGKLHLILKAHEGRSIHKFLKHSKLDYEDRVQIVHEYFKLIEKYDAFPDAIKVQLLDEEQLLISDDGLSFRELIDYAPTQSYSNKDVFKQLGKTLDLILQDAEGYHSQFIDNLILGHYTYKSLKDAKNHFKDVFIFEKPDALESINYEYTIILNDLEAGPPIKVTTETLNQAKKKTQESKLPFEKLEHNDIHHDDLSRELADLLATKQMQESGDVIESSAYDADSDVVKVDGVDDVEVEDQTPVEDEPSVQLQTPVEVDDQPTSEVEAIHVNMNTYSTEDVTINETIVSESSDDWAKVDEGSIKAESEVKVHDIEADLLQSVKTTIPNVSKDTKSFKAIFQEDDQMPESLPKSSKQRFLEEDDPLFVDDVSELFDDAEEEDQPSRNGIQMKWILISVAIILILALGVWGIKSLFNAKPVAAKFEIEPLYDNRIAFMNTSTGGKQIKAYSWEIYYADTLVQKFEDENLFPVFDTEGNYKIVMKVQDKKGNWSEPYTQEYTFELAEEATELIETTETP